MIELRTSILEDSYTDYIKEHFDYDPKRSGSVSIPTFKLPSGEWNIISIIGSSGSGKSTILNDLGGGKRFPSIIAPSSPISGCRPRRLPSSYAPWGSRACPLGADH